MHFTILQQSAGNVTSYTLSHSLSATPDLRYTQMIHKATFFESKALAGTSKWRESLHLRFSFSLVNHEHRTFCLVDKRMLDS